MTGDDKLFAPGTIWRAFDAALLFIIAVVLAALAVVSGDTTSRLICAVLVPLFLVLAYWLFRRSFPARLRGVTVSVDPDAWRGEHVDVRVELSGRAVGKEVEIGLVCTEYYEDIQAIDGVRQPVTKDVPAHEEWRPAGEAGGVQSEQFAVPANAPFSFRGEVLAYQWTVSVRDKKSAPGRNAVNVPLVVHP